LVDVKVLEPFVLRGLVASIELAADEFILGRH